MAASGEAPARSRRRRRATRRARPSARRPPSGLEEPTAAKAARGELGGEVAEGEVDNAAAGGFFGRYGRDPTGPRPTVIPQASPVAASPAAASPAAASPAAFNIFL
jgi:hypothetical protein